MKYRIRYVLEVLAENMLALARLIAPTSEELESDEIFEAYIERHQHCRGRNKGCDGHSCDSYS